MYDGFVNAIPAVTYFQGIFIFLERFGTDIDFSPRRRKLDGIIDQIADNEFHLVAVGPDLCMSRQFRGNGYVFIMGDLPVNGDDGGRHLIQADPSRYRS